MFVYKALLEALQTGDTMVPSNEIEARYPELKEKNAKTGMSAVEEQFVVRTLRVLPVLRCKTNVNVSVSELTQLFVFICSVYIRDSLTINDNRE